MEANSITFSTALDNARLEKELRALTKKIEKKERDIADLQSKRSKARDKSVFDAAALDAEKANLREIKDRLADIRAMSKDKSIHLDTREELKAQIPAVQEELADQRTRVRMLQAEWNKLENQIDGYEQKLNEATQALERQKEEAGALQQKLEAAGRSAGGNDTGRSRLTAYLEKNCALYQKLSSLTSKSAEASSILRDMAASGGKLSGAFQAAGQAVGTFSAQLSGAVAAAGPYVAIATTIIAILKKISTAMWEFGKQATQSIISGTKAVVEFAASTAQRFVEMLKSIGKFSKTAVKAVSGLTKKVINFGKKLNIFSKIADTLSSKFKRLGSTIKSALVFSVIYKGLSLLREQMGAYLSVNTEFMTALRRLQGVLLTAFQPIYEVVVPALTTLINVLARAAATVTQFFASLFGTTAKQAQTNAKNLYEQASATTAAGEAAEEASKQLAGFDEINKLEGNKSAGGGGSVSVDTGPLFDYEYDETPFDSWGEAFSAFLDKLLGGSPKLRDTFKDFADWLNGLTKKLYDMFTYPGVLDKVRQLGRELAEALNDLVNWIDWYQLGQALGAGLNLALNFLTSFLYTFDWMNLGRKLADFVNGLVSEIDWYEFGRLLWAGFKIGLETFAGFLDNLDMPQLAQAASNIILGFFTEMENTIRRIPWFNLGRQIAEFLNNIQWYDIITSIADAIHAGIIALYKLVRGFIGLLDWDGIAEQIYTALNDSIGNEALFYKLGEVFSSLFIHIFDFCRKVIGGIEWEQLGRDIAAFILGFDWVGALGSLADLIAEGINAAIKLLRGFLDKIMPEIKGIAEGIAERMKNAVKEVHWDELGQVIGDAIKAALTFVAGLLNPELFYEIGKAIGEFLINLDWPGILEGLGKAIANGIKSAVALVRGFLDSVKPNLKQLATDIATKINEFVASVDWSELGRTIHDGIDAALDFLLDILDQLNWGGIGNAVVDFLTNLDWGGLLKKWGDVVGTAIGGILKEIDLSDALSLGGNLVGGIIQGWLNKWEEEGGISGWLKKKFFELFLGAFKSLFGINSPSTVMAEQGGYLIAGLLQGISDTWHSIVDFFGEKLEALKSFFSDTWNNIKDAASSAWESIKSALSGKWDEINNSAKAKFDEVRQKISNAWENIKTDVPQKWSAIKSVLASAWEQVKTTASEKFTSIKDTIINKLDEVKNKDWFATGKSIVDGILKGLESIWNSLTSWAKSVKDTISDALSGASRSISGSSSSSRFSGTRPSVSSRITVQSMPDIGNFEIPALAKGAVIPPNREFLAVLGDQKSGNNLEGPEDTFRQIVRQENSAIVGVLREILSAIRQGKEMTVDGDAFAKLVYSKYNSESSRKGVSLVEAHT